MGGKPVSNFAFATARREHQSVVDEPSKPVLAASRTSEEQRLDLTPVQVAVRIECHEDGHVSRSGGVVTRQGARLITESKFESSEDH